MCVLFNVQINDEGDNNKNKINSTAVKTSNLYEGCVRVVLHKDITEEDVDMAIEKIKHVIEEISFSN